MIDELLFFASPLALAAVAVFGAVWGLALARAAVFTPRIGVAAALGASFILVQTGIRGLLSPTPDISVARNLGSLVLWAVFIAAVSVAWFMAARRHA